MNTPQLWRPRTDLPQTLKPHQLEAEAFLRKYRRVILADDMGAGKTLPAIRASVGRTVVICPSTGKDNWRREILREKPRASVLIVSGTQPSPIEADIDFVILNYDIADAWLQSIINWRPVTFNGDEIHVCRNRRTARFQATLERILIRWTHIRHCENS